MEFHDLLAIVTLAFLEISLSLDNAIVLAAMVKHLPQSVQKRALTYGVGGAFLFRFAALFCLTYLMQKPWVKILGGVYLLFLAFKHFVSDDDAPNPKTVTPFEFWKTVALIEIADITFSFDSILASVAVSNKFWIIFLGAIIGIISMRFAAQLFVSWLDRFPWLYHGAYIMVGYAGGQMLYTNIP